MAAVAAGGVEVEEAQGWTLTKRRTLTKGFFWDKDERSNEHLVAFVGFACIILACKLFAISIYVFSLLHISITF